MEHSFAIIVIMAEATRFLIHFYWYIKKIVDYCWSSTNVMQAQLAILLGRFGYLYWILESRILDASLSMKNLRLIIRQIQFSVFPQRNPIGRICVLFSFQSVTILSVRAFRDSSPPPSRRIISILVSDFSLFLPFNRNCLKTTCKLDLTISGDCWSGAKNYILRYEGAAYTYARAETFYGNANDRRENTLSRHTTQSDTMQPRRAWKKKTLFRLLSLSLHLFFDPSSSYYAPPSRYTRVYNMYLQ